MPRLQSDEKRSGLLRRLAPRHSNAVVAKRVSKEDFEDEKYPSLLSYQKTVSGERVNEAEAAKQAVVFSCARFLTGAHGQLPWGVRRNINDQGDSETAKDHPTHKLLKTRPNPEMTPIQFKESLLLGGIWGGNGYAEIERSRGGKPVALWPVHHSRMEPARYAGVLKYDYTNEFGKKVTIDAFNVLHIRGFGTGLKGLNVIDHAAETIGWARATELFGSAFFGNGAQHGGVIEIPAEAEFDAEARDAFFETYKKEHTGTARKAHLPAMLDIGMKWVKNQSTNDEAQFIATLTFQINQIARFFGVPPHKVNELSRATFSNIEEQGIEVVQDTISPWCVRFEQEADYKLLDDNGEHYTKFNVNALLRGDHKTRAEFYRVMVMMGALSPNDVRRLEELNGYEGGDVYVMQEQMAPVKMLGQIDRSRRASTGNNNNEQ